MINWCCSIQNNIAQYTQHKFRQKIPSKYKASTHPTNECSGYLLRCNRRTSVGKPSFLFGQLKNNSIMFYKNHEMKSIADVLGCSVKLSDRDVKVYAVEGSILSFKLENSENSELFAAPTEEERKFWIESISKKISHFEKPEKDTQQETKNIEEQQTDEDKLLASLGLGSGATVVIKDTSPVKCSSPDYDTGTFIAHDDVEASDEPDIFGKRKSQVFQPMFWRPPTIKVKENNVQNSVQLSTQNENPTILELQAKLDGINELFSQII